MIFCAPPRILKTWTRAVRELSQAIRFWLSRENLRSWRSAVSELNLMRHSHFYFWLTENIAITSFANLSDVEAVCSSPFNATAISLPSGEKSSPVDSCFGNEMYWTLWSIRDQIVSLSLNSETVRICREVGAHLQKARPASPSSTRQVQSGSWTLFANASPRFLTPIKIRFPSFDHSICETRSEKECVTSGLSDCVSNSFQQGKVLV